MNRTLQRAKSEQTVYAVQDSSDLNYKGLKKCNNLGLIGKLKKPKGTKGLRLHNRKLEGTDSKLFELLEDSKNKSKLTVRTPAQTSKDSVNPDEILVGIPEREAQTDNC